MNLAALLLAQQFARAANFQIVIGQHETRAQILQRFDGLDPLDRVRRHRLARRHDQIGVGAVVRAPDPPAQLVQLRQPQLVGAIDDNGIGAGHVDARFDDGGAHQQVAAAVIELSLIHI